MSSMNFFIIFLFLTLSVILVTVYNIIISSSLKSRLSSSIIVNFFMVVVFHL